MKTAWIASAVALCAGAASGAQAQWWLGTAREQAIIGEAAAMPARPFLLVDAPRRFLPSEDARMHVQLRSPDGGRLQWAVYRVHDPAAVLGGGPAPRQGVSVATTPLGREAEDLLLHRGGALPRRGTRLTLVRTGVAPIAAPTRDRRRPVGLAEESVVYDSNEVEEEDVQTWGVHDSEWSSGDARLGRLGPGVYLVRVHAGSWSTSALLSVGELVMLVRRGDGHDAILVTDADGAPKPGVRVEAIRDGSTFASGTTDAGGRLRLAASDEGAVRYVARHGDDVAWSDVAHARLDACDPRVYLATGRPFHREGEVVHVRGHVRGCDERGRYVALRRERVTVGPGRTGEVEVATDDRGDFVAELIARAGEGLWAEVRGERQQRELRIDHRHLPRHAVHVEVDRAFARPGEVVTVTVADDDGGWPSSCEVWLDAPGGRQLAAVGVGRPAVFHVRVPETREPVERMTLTATVLDHAAHSMAAAEIWIGRAPLLVEVHADRERAAADEEVVLAVRTSRLDAGAIPSRAAITLFGTDGNVRKSDVRWRGEARLDARGAAQLRIPMRGVGPWIVEARHGEAFTEMVMWERARPPQLGVRGELAVAIPGNRVDPGARLRAHVRVPPGAGRAWVTLEQGSVWSESLVREGGVVELAVPEESTGMATVVVSWIARGKVRTATATVEVTTSQPLALAVSTDRRAYDEGARAHVVIEARGADGRPEDAVASVWLADAGYWDLGSDDYPLPGPYLRRTGRMSSAGDSTQPVSFGAEEGRVLPEAELVYNGRALPRSTFRHAWQWRGEVVQVTERGSLAAVATALARSARLPGASVCDDLVRENPRVSLRAIDLPWDLVASHLATELQVEVLIRDDGMLRYECPGAGHGTGMGTGSAGGRGAGVPRIRAGAAHVVRESRLEGTLRFIGLLPLGADGREEIDLDLPAHPGRWRVEVLAIAADGGGDRKGVTMETRRALEAWVEAPAFLRIGDEADVSIVVASPAQSGQRVPIELEVAPGIAPLGTLPGEVTLDASGRGEARLRLRARSEGAHRMIVRAGTGAAQDHVRASVVVAGRATEQPLAVRATVGPGAIDVHVPLPPLARDASVAVTWNGGLEDAIAELLDETRQPRWNVPALRIDRLVAYRALVQAMPEAGEGADGRAELEDAILGEAAALAQTRASDDGVAWWRGLHSSPRLTAETLIALEGLADRREWQETWARLREQAGWPAARLSIVDAALVARALSSRHYLNGADRTAVASLLDRVLAQPPGDLDALIAAAEAAAKLGDTAKRDAFARRAEAEVRARIRTPAPGWDCRGPAWFLCFGQRGERATVARAAAALIGLRGDAARPLGVRVLDWIAAGPPVLRTWIWGSEEPVRLALMAAVRGTGAETPSMVVLVDGRRVAVQNGRIQVPAQAHEIVVRLGARANRVGWVRVDGELRVQPPVRAVGTARLDRSFVRDQQGWGLVVDAELPERAGDVEVRIPLPAGLDVQPGWLAPAGVRLATVAGELHLTLGEQTWQLRIPLVRVARGSFAAGPALLRASNRDVWAMTPSASVRVD